MAAGAILASNKVSSTAQAYIKDTDSGDAVSTRVDGDTGVRVEANDNASIDANSEVTVASVSTNTVDALKGLAGTLGLDDYQYTSKSGVNGISTVTGCVWPVTTRGGQGGAVYRYIGGLVGGEAPILTRVSAITIPKPSGKYSSRLISNISKAARLALTNSAFSS